MSRARRKIALLHEPRLPARSETSACALHDRFAMPPRPNLSATATTQRAQADLGEILGRPRSLAEAPGLELANTLTHLFVLLLAIGGGVALLGDPVVSGNPAKYIACSIYVVSLVSLYAASCSYHATLEPTRKAAMRVFDQVCIYLLIGGTATPLFLLLLPSPLAARLMAVVWTIGVCGIFLRLRYPARFDSLSVVLYLAMGWIGASALDSFIPTAPALAQNLVVAGGITYTAGLIFYLGESVFRWGHVVWHLFVIAGSAMHFGAVWLAVQ